MSPSYQDLLAQAREVIPEVEPSDVAPRVESGDGPLIIDVRETAEWDQGHLPGAVHVPRGFLESRVAGVAPDQDRELLISCASGQRSLLAAVTLRDMGFTNVSNLAGGFARWKQNNYPVQMPRILTGPQRSRYSRHVLIPEVGEEGQLRLLDSKVLLIGAGGLGSPAAYYLAAAGVGTIGLVDDDVLDESNLQRQIIHTTERVGVDKTESAMIAIHALNPDVKVIRHQERFEHHNALEIVGGYDIVCDGSDNFATRYLVNDACYLAGKPLVSAAMMRFDGQLTTFRAHEGQDHPCYRCLFPEMPPEGLVPSCSEAGIFGAIAGVMGTLQTAEVLKEILGIGQGLDGTLLIYDALGAEVRRVTYTKDPDCALCGSQPSITDLDVHAQFARTRQS
jgi:molybdopterin/thiamine biosynthesis adenylyltransferase/rhodanese-related sulfurtransferase